MRSRLLRSLVLGAALLGGTTFAEGAHAQGTAPPPSSPPPLPTTPPPTTPPPTTPPPATAPPITVPAPTTGQAPVQTQRPAVGTMDIGQINLYLAKLKDREREIANKLKAARKSGNDAETDRLKEELAAAKSFTKEEQDRLTERKTGLMAGGIALMSIGMVSLAASFVLGLVWALSGIGRNPDEGVGQAALIALGIGAVGLGAGIPLTVIGIQRHPREVESGNLQPRWASPEYLPTANNPTPGVSLSWTF